MIYSKGLRFDYFYRFLNGKYKVISDDQIVLNKINLLDEFIVPTIDVKFKQHICDDSYEKQNYNTDAEVAVVHLDYNLKEESPVTGRGIEMAGVLRDELKRQYHCKETPEDIYSDDPGVTDLVNKMWVRCSPKVNKEYHFLFSKYFTFVIYYCDEKVSLFTFIM